MIESKLVSKGLGTTVLLVLDWIGNDSSRLAVSGVSA